MPWSWAAHRAEMKKRGQQIKDAKQNILAALEQELPVMKARLPTLTGTDAYATMYRIEQLAEQLARTPDNNAVAMVRLVAEIEALRERWDQLAG